MIETIIIVIPWVVVLFLLIRFKLIKKAHKEKLGTMDEIIFQHRKIIKRLSPKNPCQMYIYGDAEKGLPCVREIDYYSDQSDASYIDSKGGTLCMRESTHLYAGFQICTRCAEKFIARGTNPPPEKHEFR